MATADRIALALQGFGAGVQGQGQQFLQNLDEQRKDAMVQDAFTVQQSLESGDIAGARELLLNRFENINRLGGDASDTVAVLEKLDRGDISGALTDVATVVDYAQRTGRLKSPDSLLTSGQREFKEMTQNLTPEDLEKARRIELGLDPRAVGSASQTITDRGSAEDVADTERTLSEGRKFGEMTGSSRAKAIDSGFEKIVGIDKNVRNIDKAIAALDEGAKTGVIESRFFPSFRKSTLELEQIQKELGLDVIGATTFGALSKGELDLALETALPTGLKPDELREFLVNKRTAQEKLKAYYEEQIDFLDQGGTVAGFLRMKKRNAPAEAPIEEAVTETPEAATSTESTVLRFDAQGNPI